MKYGFVNCSYCSKVRLIDILRHKRVTSIYQFVLIVGIFECGCMCVCVCVCVLNVYHCSRAGQNESWCAVIDGIWLRPLQWLLKSPTRQNDRHVKSAQDVWLEHISNRDLRGGQSPPPTNTNNYHFWRWSQNEFLNENNSYGIICFARWVRLS